MIKGMIPSNEDKFSKAHTNYDSDIEGAKRARNNQSQDSNQFYEMEGYLGMDDLEKIRRRKLR